MKIAIFGTGGVGGIFGGIWARHGHEVHFIARGKHLDAIQKRGLRVQSVHGDFHIQSALATDNPAEIGPVDLVVVCVKSWQLSEAREQMRPLIGKSTLILPLLNGVTAAAQISEVYPKDQVLQGFCAVISYIREAGVIQHISHPPRIALGEQDNSVSKRVVELGEHLRVPEIELEVPKDFLAAQWRKYLFISSLGGITSLVGQPVGPIQKIPETCQLIRQGMEEVASLARLEGVHLPAESVTFAYKLFEQMPPEGTTSMQRDYEAGNQTELEAFSGHLVRLAQKHSVKIPVHEACYALLLPRRKRESF